MVDPLNIARDRLAKAESRVQRLEKQLETARAEMLDLQITVRVMAEITGQSTPAQPAGATQGRQKDILLMLPEGEAKATPPATLYETYTLLGSDDITLDTFRTTLWRMKGNSYVAPEHGTWVVRANDGKYWKDVFRSIKEASGVKPEASNNMGPLGGERGFPPTAPEGSNPSGSTHVPASFDADLDDDVPF